MAAITQRASGRWEARVRRAGGRATSRTFATKTAATAWARAEESAIESGTWVNTSAIRRTAVQDLIEDYRKTVAEPRACPTELGRLARFVEELGHLRLEGLTPAVLIKWRDRRLKTVSASTVVREMGVLGSVLTWGQKERLLPLARNPVSAISRPPVDDSRNRRLVKDEEERLLAVMADRPAPSGGTRRSGNYRVGSRQPMLRPAFQLALETAMRQGELLGLEWKNIDLAAQTAFLPRTKNGESRTVPLSRKAVALLAELAREAGRPVDGHGPLPQGRVFKLTADALKKAWSRTLSRARTCYELECASAGLEPDDRLLDLRFHDLRHEATSRLAEKLPNLVELASVTGHKDLRMLKRYYHPRAADLALKLG